MEEVEKKLKTKDKEITKLKVILPNVVVKWFTMKFTYIDPEVHAALFVFTRSWQISNFSINIEPYI